MKGIIPLSSDPETLLTLLSKRGGGVPDFVKQALIEKGWMDPDAVDRADKAGRKKD